MIDPLLFVIVFAASLLQGFVGFGFGLVSVPLMALFMPLTVVVPLVALTGQSLNALLYFKLRRHAPLKSLWPLLFGAALGALPGLLFLIGSEERLIRVVLAIVLAAYALYALTLHHPKIVLGTGWMVVAGLFSGWLGGAMATSGPPIVVYATLQPWEKQRLKGTFATYFFFAGWLVVGVHASAGLITSRLLHDFVWMAPLAMMGALIGHYFYDRIDHALYERALYILILMIAGALLL